MATKKKTVRKKKAPSAPSAGAWPFDPRVRELLVAFLEMAKLTGRPYAIGGALAMSGHGYTRQTSDVDAFLRYEDRLEWLRAARKVGLLTDEVFRGVHYFAFMPEHGDPRIRIDLLFPAEEIEAAAIDDPVPVRIGGVVVEAFRVELLAAAKLLSDRPGDQRDFQAMLELGLFEPATLQMLLAPLGQEALEALQSAIEATQVRPRARLAKAKPRK